MLVWAIMLLVSHFPGCSVITLLHPPCVNVSGTSSLQVGRVDYSAYNWFLYTQWIRSMLFALYSNPQIRPINPFSNRFSSVLFFWCLFASVINVIPFNLPPFFWNNWIGIFSLSLFYRLYQCSLFYQQTNPVQFLHSSLDVCFYHGYRRSEQLV